MKVALYRTALCVLAASAMSGAQRSSVPATPLAQLLAEAQANNPGISAAEHASRAAAEAIPQASTLPDPKLTVQQFSVGSPKPFAGYTNSDFAYIGFGASQELPYPGKLRLRGHAAALQAEAIKAQVGVTQAGVADSVKADYIQLAYLQQTLTLLEQSKDSLQELIQDAILHYQVGKGMQQDVLQTQIQHTQLLREIAKNNLETAQTEAHLKELLHRNQASPDIVAEPLHQTAVPAHVEDLLAQVHTRNPQTQALEAEQNERNARLASAERDRKPDFALSYMYQNTGPSFRDYYMFTLDMSLPRKKRVRAEVAQASEELARSKDALDATLQAQLAEVKQQYIRASSDTEILTDDEDALLPQSEAAQRATLSAYAADRVEFSQVVSSFLAVLNVRMELLQTLADHESALARLETLTGATLR